MARKVPFPTTITLPSSGVSPGNESDGEGDDESPGHSQEDARHLGTGRTSGGLEYYTISISVAGPFHFDMDPDPRIVS